jgi:hypothetical protein
MLQKCTSKNKNKNKKQKMQKLQQSTAKAESLFNKESYNILS